MSLQQGIGADSLDFLPDIASLGRIKSKSFRNLYLGQFGGEWWRTTAPELL